MKKLIGVTLLTTAVLTGCGEGEDRQLRYLERAQDYFAEENYDKAEIDAKNVLQINPKNLEARLLLGDISFAETDIRKAYGMYQAVLAEDESNLGANTGMVKIFAAVNSFDQALEHAEKVLDVQPENAEVLGYKSVALIGKEDKEAARIFAEKALKLDAGNVAALGVMSQLYVDEKNYDKAISLLTEGETVNGGDDRLTMMKIAVFEAMGNANAVEAELVKLVDKYPQSKDNSNALARYYIRESRFDDAEKEVRKFASNNPDSLEARRRLISYLQQHNSFEAAVAQAEKYIKEEPERSDHYISLARLFLFAGDSREGMNTLEKAVEADPRSVGAIEARNIIAQMKISDKDYPAAKLLLEEVLEIEPENEDALLRRAGLSLAESKLNDGIADLRVVLKNNPENVTALQGLAAAQEANGNDQLALVNYKKLMTVQKADVNVLASAARLAIKSEQYTEAERYIRQALELEGDNAALVTNLIRLLVLKEDWNEASEFAQRLIDSNDSSALGYYLQAGLDLQANKQEEAIKNLKSSISVKPEAVETLTALAQVLAEQKGRDSAMAYVQDHCKQYPDQAHCRYILGSLHAQNSDFDEAIRELRIALELNDQLTAGYRQLAKVYGAQQDMLGIEKVLREGIEITDQNALRNDLAGFYYGTQRYEDSALVYEQILAKNEDSLAAKNNLAMIYAENIGTPEKLKAARTLVVDLQESENAAFLDTVGWVMYLNGEYDQAVTYIRAAVDKVGSSELLQYHLGMAYHKLGDTAAAKKHLALATQSGKPYPGYEEAVRTLNAL